MFKIGGVSIFVVLELLSDNETHTHQTLRNMVSIFVVLELLSDPVESIHQESKCGFNLCCVRTSF